MATAGPFHAIRTYAKNMHVKNTVPTQPLRLIRPILEMEHLPIFSRGPNTRSLSRPSAGGKELIEHEPAPVHEGRPHLQLLCLCRLRVSRGRPGPRCSVGRFVTFMHGGFLLVGVHKEVQEAIVCQRYE